MADPRGDLETERLSLRLADPNDLDDCHKIISLYTDSKASDGGHARVGMNTVEDVFTKHKVHGPKQKLCKKAAAPKGMFHLIFLKSSSDYIGFIGVNFRNEMPYPDLGYAILPQFEGKGYASEAGRAVLDWWRNVIGVEELFVSTMTQNTRSQRTAERIGFVRGGALEIVFGSGSDRKVVDGLALVLPGMKWQECDANGQRITIYPTIGVETEEQKNSSLKVH